MALNQRLFSCVYGLPIKPATISSWYHAYAALRNYVTYGDPHRFVGVSIETATYCHRACSYCPNSTYGTPRHYMDTRMYQLVISRLADIDFSGILNFSFYNEPLLDERLAEFVAYAQEKIPKCLKSIATCGDFLDRKKADALIKAGVNRFAVTIHEPGGTSLMKKLEPLISRYPRHISIITLSDEQLLNRGGLVEIKRRTLTEREIKKRCRYYLKYMVIDYQGNVLICCNDYFRKHAVGNVLEDSIDTIWNNSAFVKLRKDARNGIATLDMCKRCLGIG